MIIYSRDLKDRKTARLTQSLYIRVIALYMNWLKYIYFNRLFLSICLYVQDHFLCLRNCLRSTDSWSMPGVCHRKKISFYAVDRGWDSVEIGKEIILFLDRHYILSYNLCTYQIGYAICMCNGAVRRSVVWAT